MVTREMKDKLGTPFSKEEVQKALFDLNPSKTPGPDGLTTLFFQDAWEMIGKDITTAALRILNQGELLKN